MAESHRFVRVDFRRFKAFEAFTLHLRQFNILVGPNNCGKSTILAAFRILAAAMRRASTRKPDMIPGPRGNTLGYVVDLSAISVAEENIFYNYDDSQPATVTFKLSNNGGLLLYFPEQGSCYLIAETEGKQIRTPSSFRSHFNCPIGFVPILGPVEHNEPLFDREAARLALFNYRAARNFRNIWYHYPEKFGAFRSALTQTWPGMDIEPPRVDVSHQRPRLHMFCLEDRIPREIFWAGFGFQVWCQMLTHLIQSSDMALFLIDEPDIYLHSDLQRQLLGLLRNMGPDILIATHSTEIITEAESDDIVLINKRRKTARRITDPAQLEEVFAILGSNLNPILTQLARTRRALFVEGKDFRILGKFAQKLGLTNVGNRSGFAVVPIEGFNPERIRSLKMGMESTLGGKIAAAAVLDRDYRCDAECGSIADECKAFCSYVAIHRRKEIENFLLVPAAIDRAAARKAFDRAKRTGHDIVYSNCAAELLENFAFCRKSHVTAQYLANRRRFERMSSSGLHEATINEAALEEFESRWKDVNWRLGVIPGKEAVSSVNQELQRKYDVSVTPTAIIDAMRAEEVPVDMRELIHEISQWASTKAR
jgi:putative AbiEii toxin of type IV toxin-antitoxin system/AAA ATPase-like protein